MVTCSRQLLNAVLLCLSLIVSALTSSADCPACDNARLCGPKCLLAVCKEFEIDANVGELTTLCGTDKQGSTLAGLSNAAKSKGLEAIGMKISVDELAALKTPAIAHLWESHFVVVEADGQGKLNVLDPPAEPKSMTVADFQKEYSGFALLVAKDKGLFPASETKGPDLRVAQYSWDVGMVEEGSQVTQSIVCQNVGNEELVISKADSTCGCTTPLLAQDRIPPGSQAELQVV